MEAIAFTLPILPGKEAELRSFNDEIAGARREEYLTSRQRLGIRKERAYHQRTPAGLLAVIYIEAESVASAFQGLAASTEPFDVWFREVVKDAFGIDLSNVESAPDSELALDVLG